MATLQRRGDSFRILFVWHGKRRAFTIGKVDLAEADAKSAHVDYLLMRLQQPEDRSGPAALTQYEAQHHFQQVLKRSQWQALRGWHVLRHSFISACVMKQTIQRVIESWAGHTTEEQRRRDTHLYPAVEQQAIRSVFE